MLTPKSPVGGGGGEGRPVLPLRIKLVDDKSKSGSTTPSGPLRGGTGSKNLSRMMSRQTESTTEAKAKVSNQTPANIFWNYVEPFFKALDESDLKGLDDTARFVDPGPFTIPPLGRYYEEHWREQYGYNCTSRMTRRRITTATATATTNADDDGAAPPRVVSLRERLLAMMIEENLSVPEAEINTESLSGETDGTSEGLNLHPTSPMPTLESGKLIDYVHVDERIRQELTDAGLCMFVPKVDYQEDDQICTEMRTLQSKLREQVCLNHYRKRKLVELVRTKLPAQEFYNLLGEIDKQIEVAFTRRFRGNKKKKKGTTGGGGGAVASTSTAASPGPISTGPDILPLVMTRKRLIEAFSDIIPTQGDFLAAKPFGASTLFEAAQEEKVLQFARDSGRWLPIPEQPLQHVRLSKQPAHPVFPALEAATHERIRKSPIIESEQYNNIL